ncbi:MAG: AarF/UbiB family protein [Anaerolineales bacterium]|nr:AarF/UbiB family protein [Anaerolineales bacterium]
MQAAQLRARYRRIMTFFARATLSFIVWELVLPRLGLRRISRRTRPARYRQTAARFRTLAIRMGGVMIKVGQFLSSRLDVLPPEITDELSGLQDEVPPEDFQDIRRIAEAELGARLEETFESFDATPMAAASLGQVHRARLCMRDSESQPFCDVVVKVQRPHIEQLIEVDLSALRRVGGWLEKYRPIRQRVDVRALIEEFATTIHEEIDYLAEGRNAETFRANFEDHPRVHVPRVVWDHTTRRVLTLEDVFAIKITDYAAISAAGIQRGEVARQLLDTYLKQIFEDGFVHADPHPGNLFVTPVTARTGDGNTDWKLTFVDFGMVARVPTNLRDGLRELVISVGTRDAARLVRSYQTLDILLPGADLKLIEQAEAKMFELFWGKSMSELRQISHKDMHRFAYQFRELMYTMPFQFPQNLLMLGRTVAILSGMCTGLDADFNLWTNLAPYAQKLVSEEAGSNWRVWLEEVGEVLKTLIAIPSQAGRVLAQMERGELLVQAPQINRQLTYLEKAIYRLIGSLLFVSLMLGGVLLYNAGNGLFAGILLAASALALLWTMFFARGHS